MHRPDLPCRAPDPQPLSRVGAPPRLASQPHGCGLPRGSRVPAKAWATFGLWLMGWSVGCAPEPLPTGRTPAVHELMAQTSDANFARVEGPRELTFPADHGAHPRHQLEWWYFTGNLEGPAGEPFGFQLTFFRRALQATPRVSESAWATAANLF